jgi:NADPH-dependent glutamate synthase beta subunit-like oxidoreductase/Pyruvate/2-oxoacid:ferredoxin oxidoreductase delta subunit
MNEQAPLLTPRYRPVQVEKTPPCQLECPNAADIRRWIGFVAQRDKLGLSREEAYTRAWETIVDVNPFPAVLGRVCPHPCQTLCNRSTHDEPLAINAMEQFLGDFAIQAGLPLVRLDGDAPESTESIGVIGAGPSGLSFAYQLARRGYRVTVYERRLHPGGMLRYGIPDYRLPPAVVDAEIQRILDLGVELQLGVRVGVDVTLDELRRRHDAVYLGIGAQKGRALDVPGEPGPFVWTGAEYLSLVNTGEAVDVGERVVVVGGGNTAVDAARTARRSGAQVAMLYRRSRAEMPAIAEEVDDAIDEGVSLVLQTAPVSVAREDGALSELVASRIELGPPDASGRRRPTPMPGSSLSIPVDAVIAAVSQEPDFDGLEALVADGRLRTDDGNAGEDVVAGGDALVQGIVANAIVQGRLAAEALHARLHGRVAPASPIASRPRAVAAGLLTDFYPLTRAARRPQLAPAERLAMPTVEVTSGLGEAAFLAEAARCLSCGSCFGCQQCAMFCTSSGFLTLGQPEPGRYFALTLDQCEECGKCVSVCPCGYLEVAASPASSAQA